MNIFWVACTGGRLANFFPGNVRHQWPLEEHIRAVRRVNTYMGIPTPEQLNNQYRKHNKNEPHVFCCSYSLL